MLYGIVISTGVLMYTAWKLSVIGTLTSPLIMISIVVASPLAFFTGSSLATLARSSALAKAYAILREGEWSKPVNATVTAGGRTYTIAPLFKAAKLNPVGDFRLYRGTTRPLETP
jgi:Na+/serine symporter